MKKVLLGLTALTLWITPVFSADEITECDKLASHGSDPEKIAPGVSESGMNKAAAQAACEAAVAKDPNNRRLRYQLGRAYFYDGKVAKGIPHLEFAANAGSQQAQFVLGYTIDTAPAGIDQQPRSRLTVAGAFGLHQGGEAPGMVPLRDGGVPPLPLVARGQYPQAQRRPVRLLAVLARPDGGGNVAPDARLSHAPRVALVERDGPLPEQPLEAVVDPVQKRRLVHEQVALEAAVHVLVVLFEEKFLISIFLENNLNYSQPITV